MTALEERLRDALIEARRKLNAGDYVGAGLDLDAAATACSRLSGEPLRDPARLEDLTQACLELARIAEHDLRRELAELGAARAARVAYGS